MAFDPGVVRRVMIAGLAGMVAIGGAAGVLFSASRTGARAQTPPGYTLSGYDTSGLPGFRLSVQQTLTAPGSADVATVYGSPASPTATAPSARITALARALENNPDRIYQFVHNSILFEPQFGLHKGADGVLLDGSGGSFDQSQLMAELLRASGYQTRFVLGQVNLSGADAKSILRVDNAKQACLLLAAAGTPATVNGATDCGAMSGDVSGVAMLHLWVEAEIGGTWYAFDPSLKTNTKVAGIDLWTAAATSRSAAWNNVSSGVSVSGGALNGVNATNIQNDVAGYATTLQNALITDHSGKTLKQLAGGWEVNRTEAAPRVTATPYQASVSARWTGDVPAPYRATLRLQTAGFDHTYDLPSIYGWRTQAQLQGRALVVAVRKQDHLNGRATAYFGGGLEPASCDGALVVCGTDPGQTAFDAQARRLDISINHPYAGRRTGVDGSSQRWAVGTFGDETVAKTLQPNRRADVLIRTGGGGGGRRAAWSSSHDPIHLQRVMPTDGNTYARCDQPPGEGLPPMAEECEGQIVEPWRYWATEWASPQNRFSDVLLPAEIARRKDGLVNAWTDLFDKTVRLIEPLSGSRIFHQHSIGLASNPGGSIALDIDTAVAIAAGGTDQPHHVLSALAALSVTGEALALVQTEAEHVEGSLETPLFGTAPRRMGLGGGLQVLTTAGASSGLPGTVAAQTKAEIERYLARGFTVAASAGGDAFLARRNDGSEQAWIMLHAASADGTPAFLLKGAAGDTPNPLDYLGKEEGRRIAANVSHSLLGAVDLRTGSMSFSEGTELSVGQGEFPYSLSFSRSYVSTGPVQNGKGLGMGWTHNWESSVGHSTDLGALMPEAEIVTAAPMLMAALVALEAGRADSIEASVVSGIAMDWLQAQTANNVITVSGGGQTGRFVRLVDGSWRNPASPTQSLAPFGEPSIGPRSSELNWTLSDRSVMTFRNIDNPDDSVSSPLDLRGAATSWTFPTGVVITLAYGDYNSTNPPMLKTVSNNLGASLTFTHSQSASYAGAQQCNSTAAFMYPKRGPGYWQAMDQCHREATAGGALGSVQGGPATVYFSYERECPQGVNFCTLLLTKAKRTGVRERTYVYAAPTGALGVNPALIEYQHLLKEVQDAGVAAPVARFDWRAVGGQVAPYVAEAFDAENRKTVYYSSTSTFSSALDAQNATTPEKRTVRQAYDEDGRLIASADALGRTSRARYDGPGRTTEIQTPWGDRTAFTFDPRGNLIKRRQTPIDNCSAGLTAEQVQWWCQTIEIEAQYDTTWNKPIKIILPVTAADPTRPEWTLSYNAKGLVDVMTGPTVQNGLTGANANPVWRTWYDAYGRPTRTQDPTGIESTMAYGGSGLPAFCLRESVQGSQNSVDRIASTFVCDAVGNVTSATVGGATTTTEYDTLRRKTKEAGPTVTNIRTEWVYDDAGDLAQVKQWDSAAATWRTTTTTYSLTHKPLTVTDPSGDVARTCYDLVNRPVVTIDPELRATRTVYNAAGQPTEIHRFQRATANSCEIGTQLPDHATFTETRWRRFEYNSAGLQSAELDANGNRTEQVYDGLGRAAKTVFADTLEEWSAMDQRGQVVVRKQPGSHRVSLFYDAMGRDFHVREYADVEKTYPWTGRNSRASYDLAGRPVWRDVSNQTTTTNTFDDSLRRDVRNYTYNDGLGRLTAEQWRPEGVAGISYTTGYGYADGRGNRTSITQPQSGGSGWTITYGFDLANRVQTVSFPGASGTQTVTIAHDSLSRRTGVDRPSAAADTGYSYDVDNDLTGMTHAFVAGTGPGSTTYAYGRDAAGKVTSIGINQPTFEWMPTLAYGRTYGPASNMNRIASVSDAAESRALTWNGDGDLSQEVRTPVGGGAPVTWTYHWTYGHRLAVVTTNAAVSPLTASYHYDSDDRRTKKVVNGVTTRTMWSGTDELAEYDVNGDLIRRFIPDGTGTMDARLATVTPAGVVYWHHTDHQGSVIATSDSNGKTVGTTTYSPHGEGPPPAQSPFGYTGRQYDPETGLYYYRARYYSPYLGQFLTRDPIGTKDDPNLYMYVGLDPANATDPSGACPICVPAAVGALVGGVTGAGFEYVRQRSTGDPINWGTVAAKGAIGVGAGAISGATGAYVAQGLTLAYGAIAANAIGGATGGAVGGAINACALGCNAEGAAQGVIVGGVTGGLTGGSVAAFQAPAAGIAAQGSRTAAVEWQQAPNAFAAGASAAAAAMFGNTNEEVGNIAVDIWQGMVDDGSGDELAQEPPIVCIPAGPPCE